jgi:hypothetical protein
MPLGDPKVNVGKTLAGMRTRLILELGRRDEVATAQWNEWINDGYLDLGASIDPRELRDSFQFVSNVDKDVYILPLGTFTIRGISIQSGGTLTEGYALVPIDRDAYRKLYNKRGAPVHYFRENDLLILYPTPDAIYQMTMDVTVEVQPMTADNHSPIFAPALHEAVYLNAKIKAAEGLGLDAKAASARNSLTALIRRKRNPDSVEEGQMYGSFRPIRKASDFIRVQPRSPLGPEE